MLRRLAAGQPKRLAADEPAHHVLKKSDIVNEIANWLKQGVVNWKEGRIILPKHCQGNRRIAPINDR